MPRVALVALGGMGGSSSAAAEVALALAEIGADPVLFAARAVPRLSALPGESRAPHPAPTWVDAPTDRALAKTLRKEHLARPFDLVHVHFAGPHLPVALDFAGRFHLPLALTLHGSDVAGAVEGTALGAMVASCAGLAVPSEALQRQCFGLFEGVQVLPNFVDCARWSSADEDRVRRRSNVPENCRRILFAGHLEPWKGPDVLLDALALLPEPRPRLHILGEGSLAAPLAARASRGVRFWGARPLGPATLASVDLVVVPSLRESFGMVALEALAAGCPLVASAVGGLVDLVGPAGRLVATGRTGDPAALARTMAEALAHPDRTAQLAHQGEARARERYDRPAGLARHLDFYANLVPRAHP